MANPSLLAVSFVLLVVTSWLVLYLLWVLLDFVFSMIDKRNDLLRVAESRRGGTKQTAGEADR